MTNEQLPKARVLCDDHVRSLPVRYEARVSIHTGSEEESRASIYLPHDWHIGVLFPSPNNEKNCLIRLAALKRAADALNDLGAIVGNPIIGSCELIFPEPLKE